MNLNNFIGVHDVDYVKYAAGYASEKRAIKAIHIQSGDEFSFKNRTEMYGRKRTRDGGWLGETEQLEKGYTIDDFEILDIQIPEPIENVLYTTKRMMEGLISLFSDEKYYAFMGEGDSIRKDWSTIIEYKGNRDGLKPVYLDEISEYLKKRFKITVCKGLEADDWCTIVGQKEDHMVVTHDKDSRGTGVWTYNPQRPHDPPVNGRGFGEIYIDNSGKTVKYSGHGRKFFYYQLAYGDDVDNYRTNSATDQEWGEVSAFNALKDARNDKEAWESLVTIYKSLYPEKKKIVGWKGDIIEIDWKYVLQENVNMAHMWRNEDKDFIDIEQVFDKLKMEVK